LEILRGATMKMFEFENEIYTESLLKTRLVFHSDSEEEQILKNDYENFIETAPVNDSFTWNVDGRGVQYATIKRIDDLSAIAKKRVENIDYDNLIEYITEPGNCVDNWDDYGWGYLTEQAIKKMIEDLSSMTTAELTELLTDERDIFNL